MSLMFDENLLLLMKKFSQASGALFFMPPQGNTLFTCYVCDRTFPSSEELTQHQPTHSKDDKPFKCVHCKESFKTFSEVSIVVKDFINTQFLLMRFLTFQYDF